MPVCVVLSLLNQFMYFHKTWYRHYTIQGYPIFVFLYTTISNFKRDVMRTWEMEMALRTFNTAVFINFYVRQHIRL